MNTPETRHLSTFNERPRSSIENARSAERSRKILTTAALIAAAFGITHAAIAVSNYSDAPAINRADVYTHSTPETVDKTTQKEEVPEQVPALVELLRRDPDIRKLVMSDNEKSYHLEYCKPKPCVGWVFTQNVKPYDKGGLVIRRSPYLGSEMADKGLTHLNESTRIIWRISFVNKTTREEWINSPEVLDTEETTDGWVAGKINGKSLISPKSDNNAVAYPLLEK